MGAFLSFACLTTLEKFGLTLVSGGKSVHNLFGVNAACLCCGCAYIGEPAGELIFCKLYPHEKQKELCSFSIFVPQLGQNMIYLQSIFSVEYSEYDPAFSRRNLHCNEKYNSQCYLPVA